MTICSRSVGPRTRDLFAGALLLAMAAVPAAAQQTGSIAQSLNRAAVNAAIAPTASPTAEPQAPAAPADNPVLTFFKNTELSGFIDTYYSYNFNTPKNPCVTAGGVAVFNCLQNFAFAHNAFSLNLAELALEKKPTSDSRAGFRVDLDYGPTTTWVHALDPGGPGIYQNIQQAYVSYLAPTAMGSL